MTSKCNFRVLGENMSKITISLLFILFLLQTRFLIANNNENDKKVYELMKKYSYEGLEIAPTKVFFENPYEKLEKVEANG